jgi:ribose transport system ATP-binding protein
MSDRILVMHDGELVAELPAGSAEHEILGAATGAGDPGTAADGGAR